MSKTIKEIKEKRGQKNDSKEIKYLRVKTSIELDTKSEQKGIIKAYVSIFGNVDLGGDKILKGAFKESLKKKLPIGVWMHNWDEPIAKTILAEEDDKGLYIEGQFIEGVQKADEAYRLIKGGVIDEFSIGYRVLEDEWEEDGTRILKKLRLYEWSPVLAGMNPDTQLVGIKSDKKAEKTVNFVDSNEHRVKIIYSDGSIERKSISHKYKKYLISLAEKAEKGKKVDGEMPQNLIRIVKRINKQSSTILRLIK